MHRGRRCAGGVTHFGGTACGVDVRAVHDEEVK